MFDYKATTGFATVSQNIVPELKKAFGDKLKLDIIAINYFGPVMKEDENTMLLPASLIGDTEERKDAFGRHEFLRTLTMNDHYDGIFIIQDIGVVAPIIEPLRKIQADKKKANKKVFKSIFYFPMDCVMPKRWFDGLSFFDSVVCYTEYGRREVLKVRPDLRGKLKVILHGVNQKHFYPILGIERDAIRKSFFGANADKFIIANINRNQPRKDIPTTILGFNEYKKRYDKDALLYLHMNPKDEMGWNLYAIIEDLGLEEGKDVVFPPEGMENSGADIKLLNDIYNSADVFLTTTTGEGFGLTILEAMMCMLPVIAPLHTSITEISNGGERIFGLEESYPYCDHYDSHIREQCNYIEVAEKIDQVRNSAVTAEEKTRKAFEYARELTWASVCERWIDEFDEVFKITNKKTVRVHNLIPVAGKK